MTRRRVLSAVLAVAAAVVTGLAVAVVVRDDADPGPATSPDSAPTASAVPSPSPSPDRTPQSRQSPQSPPSPPSPQRPEPAEPTASDPFPPGSLETVSVGPAVTRPPVPLDEPASFGNGLVARLTGLEAVQGEARGPGEIAGPALRVVVELRNTGGRAVSLERSVVTVSHGREPAPGVSLSGPGVRPLAGSLRAGDSATGSYVFGIPEDDRAHIQVTISVDASRPTVLFEGSAP